MKEVYTSIKSSFRTLILLFYFLLVLFLPLQVLATILEVGSGKQYSNLSLVAANAQPGDTIMFFGGIYPGGQSVSDLHGTKDKPIFILAQEDDEVIIRGGTNAWQLSDVSYLHIKGFIFEGQTGNGVNIDDAGTFDTPTHHITIENCSWRDMNASGNNDQLKLSGVDSTRVEGCLFMNGSAGGSQIDMVGCHNNTFIGNTFRNGGSNSIQSKGGSRYITIERNLFVNGGQRTLNIGGSTGLQFFRPLDADYEASDIYVWSNIFIGSQAPIAFVGAVNCEVANNTIINPDKWAIRILQESTDARFRKCGNNTFINNIVYFNINPTAESGINIGGNTDPGSFTFSNNLWFSTQNPNYRPNTGVNHHNSVLGADPLFLGLPDSNFLLSESSPAIGIGMERQKPEKDYLGNYFASPRDLGAVAYNFGSSMVEPPDDNSMSVYPNPANGFIRISGDIESGEMLGIFSYDGTNIMNMKYSGIFDVRSLPQGVYYITKLNGKNRAVTKITIVR